MPNDTKQVKLLIVGAGVSGAAAAFAAAATNLKGGDIAVIEQYSAPGSVNSHPLFNAQTVHRGPLETNYGLEQALRMNESAMPLLRFLHARPNPQLWRKCNHMVLAVGHEEVAELEVRYERFKPHYPDIRLIYGDEIGKLEPKVMEGRDPSQDVCAITTDEGHVCNYQVLANELLKEAQLRAPGLTVRFNTTVLDVRYEDDGYTVKTSKGTYRAAVIIFASGAYSLDFAHRLGYARNLSQGSIAGDFYSGGPLLKGKVYRCAKGGRPFSAPHGDVDILDPDDTRFGPTTKILPFLERYNYRTVDDFVRITARAPIRNLLALVQILAADGNLGYLTKQWMYSLPFLGKALLLPELREIVPSLRYSALKRRRNAGGIRPQVIDLEQRKLIFGNVIIRGKNVIFMGTPSPGGSKSVHNGEEVMKDAVKFLGPSYRFDQATFDDMLDRSFEPKSAASAA